MTLERRVDADGFLVDPTRGELNAHLVKVAAARGGARAGAAMMRSIEFSRWCPPCQRGDHWNHEPHHGGTVGGNRGPIPASGACWSVQMIGGPDPCHCPWRPS